MPKIFRYIRTITKVVDGDTVDAVIDLGFTIFVKERFRLLGINAPEIHVTEAPEAVLRTEGASLAPFKK